MCVFQKGEDSESQDVKTAQNLTVTLSFEPSSESHLNLVAGKRIERRGNSQGDGRRGGGRVQGCQDVLDHQ